LFYYQLFVCHNNTDYIIKQPDFAPQISLSLEVHGVHVVRGAIDEDITDQVEARHLGGEWRLHDAQSLTHTLRDLNKKGERR